jgi:hypothetical protein
MRRMNRGKNLSAAQRFRNGSIKQTRKSIISPREFKKRDFQILNGCARLMALTFSRAYLQNSLKRE